MEAAEALYRSLTNGSVTSTSTTTVMAPRGWRSCWSAEHSCWYFVNQDTGVSSWTLPAEEALADEAEESETVEGGQPAKKQKVGLVAYGGSDDQATDSEDEKPAACQPNYNSYFDAKQAQDENEGEENKWQAPFAARPSSVFVSGLPHPDSTSDDALQKKLKHFFGVKVSLKRSVERGNAGTLSFESPEAADGALRKSGEYFLGRPLHVRPSYRKETFFIEQPDRVYLRGLPPDMQSDAISALFSDCGKVQAQTISTI